MESTTATLVPAPSKSSTEEVSEGEVTEEVTENTDDGDVSRETTDEDGDDGATGAASHGKEEEAEAEEEDSPSDGKQKLRRKVNGKWVEKTAEELWKHYGKEEAATRKGQEAAEIRKEALKIKADAETALEQITDLFARMKEKPEVALELLEKLGHDPKQIIRKKALEEMEYERMDPKDREILELRKKAELADKLQKDREEHEAKTQQAQLRQQFTNNIDNLMAETFKLSGFQPKPKTIARMAEACQTLINASKIPGELPSAQQVLDKFLGYGRSDLTEFYAEQDPDSLAKLGMLPDHLVDKLVKWHLAKNKAKLPSFGNQQTAEVKKPTSTKQKSMTIDQFFNNIGSKN